MTLKQRNCQSIGIYLLQCPISKIMNIYSENPFEVLEGSSGHDNISDVSVLHCTNCEYKKQRGSQNSVLCQFDGQGVYCGLSTSSEGFLIFTTQLYSCFCNYNAIDFISCQEGSIATGVLPTSNTPLSSLPVGSK